MQLSYYRGIYQLLLKRSFIWMYKRMGVRTYGRATKHIIFDQGLCKYARVTEIMTFDQVYVTDNNYRQHIPKL